MMIVLQNQKRRVEVITDDANPNEINVPLNVGRLLNLTLLIL